QCITADLPAFGAAIRPTFLLLQSAFCTGIARTALAESAGLLDAQVDFVLAEAGPARPSVRRKRCALLIGTPAEAVEMMDAMDYDAHLFTDSDTGEDALVSWAEPHAVRLTRQCATTVPARTPRAGEALAVHVRPEPAPVLTESEAAAHLCRHGLPHLFFTDVRTHRGRLLYRRYDGDLTIVVPA
ncbi:sigma 54 modulation/S30EA ribosomal C-terminal domain-containing protein, partial [Nocardia farcinica]|uniref:sigma 54 modulation/S30EA ribosomal C-terminal domain-containing protein n=1 Tax=Nocardia farcinica TaxID=37329 RepID=UPI0024575013